MRHLTVKNRRHKRLVQIHRPLTRTTHIPRNRTPIRRASHKPLTIIQRPLMNVRLPQRHVSIEPNNVVVTEAPVNHRVHALTVNLPVARKVQRLFLQQQRNHQPIRHANSDKRRRVIRLTTIEPEHDPVTRLQRRLTFDPLPLRRREQVALRLPHLIQVHATRLRRRTRRIQHRPPRLISITPHRIPTHSVIQHLKHALIQRRIIRGLKRVIKHVSVRRQPLQRPHERIAVVLSHRTLTRLIRIRNSQIPGLHLRRITLNRILQLLPIILRQPVLRLIQQCKSTTVTLRRTERRGFNLNTCRIVTTTNNLQTHIHAILRTQPVTNKHMEHIERIARLLLLQRENLHQRLRTPTTNRLTIRTPPRKTRRTKRLNQTQNSKQRVFTPTLNPLQHASTSVNELTLIINRIPPQHDTQLLQGKLKHILIRTKRLQIIRTPPGNLPTQRMLRQHKPAILATLPRRPIMHRRKTLKNLSTRQTIIGTTRGCPSLINIDQNQDTPNPINTQYPWRDSNPHAHKSATF